MWYVIFFFDSVPDTQTGADSLVSVVVESWAGSDRSLFLLQTLWPHKCGFNMLMCCVCEWFHSCNTSKGEVTHWRWPWLTAFVMQWRLCCCDSTWTPDGSRTTHFHWRSMRSTHYSSNGSPVNHTHFPFFSSICQAIYYLQIPVKSAAIFADHLPALSCSWWRSKLAEKKQFHCTTALKRSSTWKNNSSDFITAFMAQSSSEMFWLLIYTESTFFPLTLRQSVLWKYRAWLPIMSIQLNLVLRARG